MLIVFLHLILTVSLSDIFSEISTDNTKNNPDTFFHPNFFFNKCVFWAFLNHHTSVYLITVVPKYNYKYKATNSSLTNAGGNFRLVLFWYKYNFVVKSEKW